MIEVLLGEQAMGRTKCLEECRFGSSEIAPGECFEERDEPRALKMRTCTEKFTRGRKEIFSCRGQTQDGFEDAKDRANTIGEDHAMSSVLEGGRTDGGEGELSVCLLEL
jgi:hypothetical protein|tara:strand:- start:452 stop:778 length:327 start_codon:yes stop_codon:yes gene_type:complete